MRFPAATSTVARALSRHALSAIAPSRALASVASKAKPAAAWNSPSGEALATETISALKAPKTR
ncbi:hypothetical protein JOE62_002204 [Glutamicibacter nicotianae]|nr:hypothetical protein [Glutamicibacter nicotianae]